MEDLIRKRRSVREFDGRDIERAVLEEICIDGLQAPSARNTRPWELIVVQERAVLRELSEIRGPWKCLRHAAAAIVVSARYDDYYQQNCGALAENILLSATQRGIGSVWLGLYPHVEESGRVQRMLGCPGDVIPFCVIALGYPGSDDVFYEKKTEPGKIHWGKW